MENGKDMLGFETGSLSKRKELNLIYLHTKKFRRKCRYELKLDKPMYAKK